MSVEPSIVVKGARVNLLRSLDVDLPRGRLIALTGVSGSGKSSLALGVLVAEGQRRLLEALSGRLRGRVESLPRPDVDLITGLPPTIGVSAPPAASGRSTVATRTELHDLLRAMWAHAGVARCPVCGLDLPTFTADSATARLMALPEGTRLTLAAPVVRGKTGSLSEIFDEMQGMGFARARVDGEIHRLDERPTLDARAPHDVDVVIDRIRVAPDRAERVEEAALLAWSAGKGRMLALVDGSEGGDELFFADHPACPQGHVSLASPTPALFSFNSAEGACERCEGTGRSGEAALEARPCPDCLGSRLSANARAFRVGGQSLPELLGAPCSALLSWAAGLQLDRTTAPIRDEILRRARLLVALGPGYLAPGRGMDTLSAGEARRVHLASQISGDLSGVLYVLDEPTAGLGPEESAAVLGTLKRLVEAGNSVLMVTHDPLLVGAAEQVLEIGPGAGAEGGRLLYQGPPDGLSPTESVTGRARAAGHPPSRGRPTRGARGEIRLQGAVGMNLREVELRLPLGCLVSVSGPSGSGKTALIDHTLGRALAAGLYGAASLPLPYASLSGHEGLRRLVRLSQAPLGRSGRSCTATVAGVWGPMRRLLAATREARVRGYGPEIFSFNRPGGRCATCEGTGVRAIRLHLLPDTTAPCERCEGRRFGPGALSVRYRGHDVAQLLELTVGQARRLFMAQPDIEPRLRALESAGLGYLRLGQPADTLSGGEAERVRLSRELGRMADLPGTLYLLDAPAMGLHPQDVHGLVTLLQELVDGGASVVAVDNDPGLVAAADLRLRLGPGAGPEGGRLQTVG